jgi:hypothetical protein
MLPRSGVPFLSGEEYLTQTEQSWMQGGDQPDRRRMAFLGPKRAPRRAPSGRRFNIVTDVSRHGSPRSA